MKTRTDSMTTERSSCCFCLGSCKMKICTQCSATAHNKCVLKYIGSVNSDTDVRCPLCRGDLLLNNMAVKQPNTRLQQRIVNILGKDIKNVNRSVSYTAEKHFHNMILHIIEHFSVLRRDLTLMIALKEKLTEAIITWHQCGDKYMDLFYQIFGINFSYEPPMFIVQDLTAQYQTAQDLVDYGLAV